MLPAISKLIRATYASNAIDGIINNPRLANIDPSTYAREYFNIELTCVNEEGRTVSCGGKYATNVFLDILDKTGYDLTANTSGNIRKRILGITTSYESKTPYKPQVDKQQMILDYVGCRSWQELNEDAEELLAEAEAYLQDVADGNCQPNINNLILSPKAINEYKSLTIRFADCTNLFLDSIGCCRFRVINANDTGLNVDDVIEISDRILIGGRLIADVVSTRQNRLSSLWLSSSIIRSFRIEEAHTRLIA